MDIFQNRADLAARVKSWKQEGLRVGLVPTMGNLHDGHLSLLAIAAQNAERVIVSIYVNPLQFAQNEDFDSYPRTFAADLDRLKATGLCHAVYNPPAMYDDTHATTVKPAGLAAGYESASRPHFFAGVATVVLKLFTRTAADVAVFGEKDYQQLQVIKQMTADLDLPVNILSGPTVREADGLALSSRNSYLGPAERSLAPRLYAELGKAATAIKNNTPPAEQCNRAAETLISAGFSKIDYFSYCDSRTLATRTRYARGGILLAAVHLGPVRLIDCLRV